MGASNWHVARADRHLEVATFLAKAKHDDWAAVALFYAALAQVQSVLSSDPILPKDERHPRKHTAGPAARNGGRGTNQLVAALFPQDVHLAYRSLGEASHRTRYDHERLGGESYPLLLVQFNAVESYCRGVRNSRPDRNTSAP